MIPVCDSANGLDYLYKKFITLKELMQIKDVCKNRQSDHYIFTPGKIKKLSININGSTINTYMQVTTQQMRLFIKCVLPKYRKYKASIMKNGIVPKKIHIER